jgi:hypothetical protein
MPSANQDDFYLPNDYQQAVYYSLVVCVLASWLHTFYYLMAFETTGPFVLTLYMIISSDVVRIVPIFGSDCIYTM